MLNNGVDPKVIISETINFGLVMLAGKGHYNIISQENDETDYGHHFYKR